MSQKPSIFERLADPATFTGSHRERFDQEGRGRGLAGREDVVEFSGWTCSAGRDPFLRSTPGPEIKRTTVASPIQKPRSIVSVKKPAVITVFRNGDKHHEGVSVVVKGHYKNLQQLLDELTRLLKLCTGAVKKVYKQDRCSVVRSLLDFEDGGKYLCCAGEPPAPFDQLPLGFLSYS